MSEFFKALEQAERDRKQQDREEATSAAPVSETSERTNGAAGTEASVSKPAVSPPITSKPVTSNPPVSKSAAQKPPASQSAESKPAISKSTDLKPTVSEPPESKVAGSRAPLPYQAPSPASVFRPSLRTPERPRLRSRFVRAQPLLIAQSDPSSIAAEAYRTVRANIELMPNGAAFRCIAITSATGGDGKSTTAANLAVVAAQGGRRVCLVDADVRRPTLHDIFGLSNVDGLRLALEAGKPLQAVAKSADIDNLSIVVAGRSGDEAFHDLLTPRRLESILRDSQAAFDIVLFDTPPVISVADTLNIAAVCDGVILVVRAGSIPVSVVRRAVAQIRHVKGRVLGVLLNQVDLRAADADFYRYHRAYHATGSKS